jgi:hypothetical protein
MFTLTEAEHWCVVCINEARDDVRIVRESHELKVHSDFAIMDYDLERTDIRWPEWHSQKPGLYMLMLEPIYDEGIDEKMFEYLKVTSVEMLYEL